MQRLALAALAILFLSMACAAQAQTGPIRLATTDWPPYIGDDLPQQGYAAEVARQAFARVGVEAQVVFLPWKRAMEETRAGKFHAFLPAYFSAQRTRDFVFSAPFTGGELAFMVRRDSTLAYKTLRDLRGKRIGVVRGYANTPAIDSADFLTKEESVDDEMNLRMLLNGRLDMAVADVNVANYIATERLGRPGAIRPLKPTLGERLLYLCFPKSRPDHLELVALFDKGLAAMRADGSLRRLALRFGFTPDVR